jgi:aryl carrier-like protein
VKPPPRSLPTARSRKWHNRRWWDPLGYFRVRSLGNPNWRRDTEDVRRRLVNARARAQADETDALDAGLDALRAYERAERQRHETDDEFAHRRERLWDLVLAHIDEYLERHEARFLATDEGEARGDA